MNSVKTIFALSALIFLSVLSFGQEKKDLSISISTGVFNSPYYQRASPRNFYGVGFNYHLSERHILSTSYLAGKHDYYDEVLSNDGSFMIYPTFTNAKASYSTFSISYKYNILNKTNLKVTPGIGAGILTHTREYPFTEGTSTIFHSSTWSDLVFPVSLEVTYTVFRQWQLGLTSGFLVHPDYPVIGLHVGPKLSYILK